MKVQILLFDEVDILDVMAPYEVLLAATEYTDETIDVRFVSIDERRTFKNGISNYELQAETTLDTQTTGLVLIPGASGSINMKSETSIPFKLNKIANQGVTDKIKEVHRNPNMTIASVCGGGVLLAMADIIKDRHVTAHFMGLDLLEGAGAHVVNARVVDDGDIVSGAGVTSGLDLAFYLVERELGPQIAYEIERLFQYEKRGTVWKNVGQAPKLSVDQSTATEEDVSGQAQQIDGEEADYHHLLGYWNVTIKTPIAELNIEYHFYEKDQQIYGIAIDQSDKDNISELNNIQINQNNVTWQQSVKKPMKLNLKFNVSLDSTKMKGNAKMGFVSSKLEGQKINKKYDRSR